MEYIVFTVFILIYQIPESIVGIEYFIIFYKFPDYVEIRVVFTNQEI